MPIVPRVSQAAWGIVLLLGALFIVTGTTVDNATDVSTGWGIVVIAIVLAFLTTASGRRWP